MKTIKIWIALILILVFLSFVSCTPPKPTVEPVTYTPTQTPTPCPPVTPIPVKATSTATPIPEFTHFFILIDVSGSYREHFLSSLEVLNDSLSQIVHPGDRLTIAWLGANSGQSGEKIFDETSPEPDIRHPEYFEVGTMPLEPEYIEIPTERSGGTTMDGIEYAQTVQAISTLNQINKNQYHCDVGKWNQELMRQENNSAPVDYENGHEDFIKRASQEIHKARNVGTHGYTDVYSAFWDVSEIFAIDRATGQFQRFVLFIFSDLDGNITHQNLKKNVDFRQTKIIVANYPCGAPSSCQFKINAWKTDFQDKFGAEVVEILRPEDTSIQSLVYLSRR